MTSRFRLTHLFVLFALVVLTVFASASTPQPVKAAGSVAFTFNCDALIVEGTTDQYAVDIRVVVRFSGLPGITRASQLLIVAGTGMRSFRTLVAISPTLTNPAPTITIDPDSMVQYIWIRGLNSSLAPTETYAQTGATCGGYANPGCLFTDGRINCRAEDAAQTVAIYCTGDGGVTIWAISSNSIGKLAFTATKAEIDKVPANPDVNTLIKKAQNIALYRLHGGKLQVNAPGGYVYIWDHC